MRKQENNKQSILRIFLTATKKKNIKRIKQKIKDFNNGNFKIYLLGNHFSLFELNRFSPDIVISDYDNGDVYIKSGDCLKKSNPFH